MTPVTKTEVKLTSETYLDAVARIIDPTAWHLRDELARTSRLPDADKPPAELTARATKQCDTTVSASLAKAVAVLDYLTYDPAGRLALQGDKPHV